MPLGGHSYPEYTSNPACRLGCFRKRSTESQDFTTNSFPLCSRKLQQRQGTGLLGRLVEQRSHCFDIGVRGAAVTVAACCSTAAAAGRSSSPSPPCRRYYSSRNLRNDLAIAHASPGIARRQLGAAHVTTQIPYSPHKLGCRRVVPLDLARANPSGARGRQHGTSGVRSIYADTFTPTTPPVALAVFALGKFVLV